MRDTIHSMMRFSGAVTMFGLEQVQNAMNAPSDTKAALNRLRETLDTMSETLAAKLDESKKSALDSMSKAQIDILDRTAGAVNLDGVNLDAAADLLKRTSDSLSGAMRGSKAA
jgi:hypothetical protein